MRDIQTNELSHSQDSKMTDKKSKLMNSVQCTPMNGQHEICGVGEDRCIKYKRFVVGICG